jgi:predicted DCC family thiol-disulfide oxidoreductase YuxK
MEYYVIYDGNCNLCVNFTKILEQVDQGKTFSYIPMQAKNTLKNWQITPEDCQLGMILIDANQPDRRWQGSDAAEEITRLLPIGKPLIDWYRQLPQLKNLGDRLYSEVRDNRYQWFGKRKDTYISDYCNCTSKEN